MRVGAEGLAWAYKRDAGVQGVASEGHVTRGLLLASLKKHGLCRTLTHVGTYSKWSGFTSI